MGVVNPVAYYAFTSRSKMKLIANHKADHSKMPTVSKHMFCLRGWRYTCWNRLDHILLMATFPYTYQTNCYILLNPSDSYLIPITFLFAGTYCAGTPIVISQLTNQNQTCKPSATFQAAHPTTLRQLRESVARNTAYIYIPNHLYYLTANCQQLSS